VPHISPLSAADRDDWDRLWRAYLVFYETELAAGVTDDVFDRLVADTELHGSIACDESGTAIGLVHWLTHPSTWSIGTYCYLEDLFVDPAARQGGVGSALIAHVRDWAHRHGCDKVYWLTQQHNTTARRLYDRLATSTGFVHYECEDQTS
jgi:GNAT superfamily N-acetyltransferase